MSASEAPRQPGSASQATPLGRIVRAATTVELFLAGTATFLIFALVLAQAGQRYLPIDGWIWSGELARYCLVWLTFVAAGVLVTRDGHIALQIVDSIRSDIVLRSIRVFALLVVAATGLGLAWACWTLIGTQRNLELPTLGISMTWVYLLPLLGFVSTFVRALASAVFIARYGVPAKAEAESLTLHPSGEEPI